MGGKAGAGVLWQERVFAGGEIWVADGVTRGWVRSRAEAGKGGSVFRTTIVLSYLMVCGVLLRRICFRAEVQTLPLFQRATHEANDLPGSSTPRGIPASNRSPKRGWVETMRRPGPFIFRNALAWAEGPDLG